jgi:branched-chain amino acid transport system permease protein
MTSLPVRLRENSAGHRALQTVGVVVLIGLAYYASTLNSFRVGQVTLAMIYATAIVGLNLATGYTGQLSIGHSAFFGLGAYTTGILVESHNWNPLLTFIPAIVFCFVLGVLVGLPSLRIRGINLALVTLALGVAFPELVDRFPSLTGGQIGLNINIYQLLPPKWTGISIGDRSVYYYWIAAFLLALAMILSLALTRSRAGLSMRATRDRETAAAAMGVNLSWVKMVVFGLSGAITGAAGCVFAIYLGSLSADSSFTLLLSITLITGLVIGGVATVIGPLLGGLAVTFIPYWTANIRQGAASGLFFGVILIVLMFVMPEGLMGLLSRLSRRVLRIDPQPPPPRAAATAGASLPVDAPAGAATGRVLGGLPPPHPAEGTGNTA